MEIAGRQAPAVAQDMATKRLKRSKSAGDVMPAGAAASWLPSILRSTSSASLQAAHLPWCICRLSRTVNVNKQSICQSGTACDTMIQPLLQNYSCKAAAIRFCSPACLQECPVGS